MPDFAGATAGRVAGACLIGVADGAALPLPVDGRGGTDLGAACVAAVFGSGFRAGAGLLAATFFAGARSGVAFFAGALREIGRFAGALPAVVLCATAFFGADFFATTDFFATGFLAAVLPVARVAGLVARAADFAPAPVVPRFAALRAGLLAARAGGRAAGAERVRDAAARDRVLGMDGSSGSCDPSGPRSGMRRGVVPPAPHR